MKATELLIYLKNIQSKQYSIETITEALEEKDLGSMLSKLDYINDSTKEVIYPFIRDALEKCKADSEKYIKEKNIEISTSDIYMITEQSKSRVDPF